MNRDLFLAILSMDSYNRGYGRGIKFSANESSDPKNEIGVQIGKATILRQNISDAAIAAGFYALAYDMTANYGDSALNYCRSRSRAANRWGTMEIVQCNAPLFPKSFA